MSVIDDLVQLLKKQRTSGSDYTGVVTRVEGETAYVRLTGSNIPDTPVAMTITAAVGDKVRVRINGGRAWITGNDTLPPSNEKEAVAGKMSKDMADREKHIIIRDGMIKFIGNTLVIESNNFSLNEAGDAEFSGTLKAAGGSFSGHVSFDWGMNNPQMAQRISIGNNASSPFYVESLAADDDTTAALDAWGFTTAKDGGRIFTQVSAEDGIQTTEKTSSQRGLGIDCGMTSAFSVAAGNYEDKEIDFNFGFATPPVVVCGFRTGSTSGDFGKCCCGVVSVSYTSATIRVWNGGTATRLPGVSWIAVGQ